MINGGGSETHKKIESEEALIVIYNDFTVRTVQFSKSSFCILYNI